MSTMEDTLMTLTELWDKSQKECLRLDYHFSKKEFRVPPEVRQDICEMTQLPNISRLEMRPEKDKISVCFYVPEDKNEAKKLVRVLCSMVEVWRHYNNIILSAVPKKRYYQKDMRER